MHRLVSSLAAVTIWALAHGAAIAASGTAMGVDPAAEAERKGTSQTLVVGTDIFIGDRVVTGDGGQVQIRFSDSTELVVGPRSALLIEDYLLRENGSAGKLAINALAGSFRFVTGTSAKNRYQIKTPTGTIGVRGTALDVFVGQQSTSALLYHGSIVICSNAGDCETLTRVCELGQFDGGQAALIGHTDGVTGADRETLRSMFRYAQSQRPLLRDFRVAEAERCLKRPAGGSGPKSLIDGPGRNRPGGGQTDGGTPPGGGETPSDGGQTPSGDGPTHSSDGGQCGGRIC